MGKLINRYIFLNNHLLRLKNNKKFNNLPNKYKWLVTDKHIKEFNSLKKIIDPYLEATECLPDDQYKMLTLTYLKGKRNEDIENQVYAKENYIRKRKSELLRMFNQKNDVEQMLEATNKFYHFDKDKKKKKKDREKLQSYNLIQERINMGLVSEVIEKKIKEGLSIEEGQKKSLYSYYNHIEFMKALSELSESKRNIMINSCTNNFPSDIIAKHTAGEFTINIKDKEYKGEWIVGDYTPDSLYTAKNQAIKEMNLIVDFKYL